MPTVGSKKTRAMNSLASHPRFSAGEIRRESTAHPGVQRFPMMRLTQSIAVARPASADPRAFDVQSLTRLSGQDWRALTRINGP
jgi:hypothetical protein